MKLDRGQVQVMDQERPWDAGVLVAASRELERNVVFRDLAGELTAHFDARSRADRALVALLPSVLPAVRAYYAGGGRALRERLTVAEMRALDAWLRGEIRYWAERWSAADAARSGAAPSTSEALAGMRAELHARERPARIAAITRKIVE
jgi:hypothetical protein